MCLDVVNGTRIRKKPAKLANNHELEQYRSAKRYRYKARGTRTSPLVKKAIPSATAP
ncbi:hypothetical protein [Alteromonas sp. 14N.309.X.WAT.G.H12]|uniref:hypothetical protein n=1 Tax=Alteromonas sp. 14N.309.X.WAT.G.H12 TaxID=3120824 RepID=UPI002FD2AA2C